MKCKNNNMNSDRNHQLTAPPLPLCLGPLAGRGDAAAHAARVSSAAVGEHLGGGARLENVDAHGGGGTVAEGDIEEADPGEAEGVHIVKRHC